MYTIIKKSLILVVFSLIISSEYLKAAQENATDFNSYRIINAVTGNELNLETYSKEVEIIKTNLTVTSEIRKTLVENGINLSKIDISLYFEGLFVSSLVDDYDQEQISNQMSNDQTVSSPWMELTKTFLNSGEKKIEIKIDATDSRLMMDAFSYRGEAFTVKGFREIPDIKQTCFNKVEKAYVSNKMSDGYEIFELADAFDCVPKPMRRPLLSLFESSDQVFLSTMTELVYQKLDICSIKVQDYYSRLYPLLALRALQILESNSNPEPFWWMDIVKQIHPIQVCPQMKK